MGRILEQLLAEFLEESSFVPVLGGLPPSLAVDVERSPTMMTTLEVARMMTLQREKRRMALVPTVIGTTRERIRWRRQCVW